MGDTPSPAYKAQLGSFRDDPEFDAFPNLGGLADEYHSRAQMIEQRETRLNGPPNEYALETPEGLEANPELLARFVDGAKEAGLSQRQAEGLFQLDAELFDDKSAHDRAWIQQRDAGEKVLNEQLKDNVDLTITEAKRIVGQFLTAEEAKVLHNSGVANLPAFVRALASIFPQIGEDSFTDSGDTRPVKTTAAQARLAEIKKVFPNSWKHMEKLRKQHDGQPDEAAGFFPSMEGK